MKMRVLLLLILYACLACKDKNKEHPENVKKEVEEVMKFDKEKWNVMDGSNYVYRDKMLEDLVYNVTLKGLKRDEILDLLGEPDRTDSSYLFYTIAEPRMFFITLHQKALVIKLAMDSTVEWRKIYK